MSTDSDRYPVVLMLSGADATYEVSPPPGPVLRPGQKFVYYPAVVPSPMEVAQQSGREPTMQEREAHTQYNETMGLWYVEEVFWELSGPEGGAEPQDWIQRVTLVRTPPVQRRGGR